MSTSTPSAQNSKDFTPFIIKRRRTILACSNCRRRKIRCITTEQPPTKPCQRCTKKGLHCEYVAATDYEDNPSSTTQVPEMPLSNPPSLGTTSSANRSQGLMRAPSLPYTGPPPLNRRPRYSSPSAPAYISPGQLPSVPGWNQGALDRQYWDPSIAGSSQTIAHPPYPSLSLSDDNTYQSNALRPPQSLNQGYDHTNPYPYSSRPSSYPPLTQLVAQSPSAPYPLDYGQTQFFSRPSIPEDQWSSR
ncbi:hypothetical protein C8R44DRAFT_741226 [Mycena epipterygia]|nr:hypothetical protein C8R44DRAFT_741226 [Mycena epipterygia]